MTTYLYRLWHDDNLLYVGITLNPTSRLNDHRVTKKWWGHVTSVTLEMYLERSEAEKAEEVAIQTELPEHNELSRLDLIGVESSIPLFGLKERGTKQVLPDDEVEFLNSLDRGTFFARCAELYRAGWRTSTIARQAKVSPTVSNLNTGIKQSLHLSTGRPVPPMPDPLTPISDGSRSDYRSRSYSITESESKELCSLAPIASKNRPNTPPSSRVGQANQRYIDLVNSLYSRGASVGEIADASGVTYKMVSKRVVH
jgi:predicted GIY-YIG superfamily endonuclease